MNPSLVVDEAAMHTRLPAGVLAEAERLWRNAGHEHRSLDDMLNAPLVLEPDWPAPRAPLAVGDGFVHADVIDDDLATLTAILEAVGAQGPEAVATAAQELRLPVSPYRRPALPDATHDRFYGNDCVDETVPARPEWAAGKTVIDLTTHWAGPLATSLLADAGARVIKIDPDCRPDGFRDRPNLYHHLNGAKEVIDLDLREDGGRTRFEQLVAEADLLIESFSRRVMTNLGYGPESLRKHSPGLATVSIRAFPAGSAEQDWLGYGPAIHAISGLAYGAQQAEPIPAPVAYPDVLAGLAAYGAALRLLGDQSVIGQNTSVRNREVSLLAAVQPLLLHADLGSPDSGAG